MLVGWNVGKVGTTVKNNKRNVGEEERKEAKTEKYSYSFLVYWQPFILRGQTYFQRAFYLSTSL